ncbi:MAG: hypothetical protein V3S08_08215 [Phycisphaerales bacterium]
MYWADKGTLKIQRANLDGTVIEDLVATGVGSDPAGQLELNRRRDAACCRGC